MIGAIILAAGMSTRMGESKLSLMLDGKPIVEHVINKVEVSQVNKILVVYSEYTKPVEAIAKKHGLASVENHKTKEGLSTSLKCGLSKLLGTEAVMFLLGDQPFIETQDINKLIQHYKSNRGKIIVPVNYEGRGNPVIFPEKYYEEILTLEGDKGARLLLDKYVDDIIFVEIEDSKIQFDIDTRDDFEKAKNKYKKMESEKLVSSKQKQ